MGRDIDALLLPCIVDATLQQARDHGTVPGNSLRVTNRARYVTWDRGLEVWKFVRDFILRHSSGSRSLPGTLFDLTLLGTLLGIQGSFLEHCST